MKTTLSLAASGLTAQRQLLVAALLTVDSLHFVFARLLLPHLSPSASTFYVSTVSVLVVGGFGVARRRLHARILASHWRFFVSIGALIAANFTINYESVNFIDPGTAALLAKSTILMSFGLGLLWLGEHLSRHQIIGALIAIVGVLVIVFQPADYIRVGSLLVLFSSFLYALHTAIVKRFGGEMDFVEFFFFRLLLTGAFLFCVALGRQSLVWPDAGVWPLIVVTGLVDIVLSRSLFYLALRWMHMSVHAIVLALSPVVAILWSLILFDVHPTLTQGIGGIGVICGVMLVMRRPLRRPGQHK